MRLGPAACCLAVLACAAEPPQPASTETEYRPTRADYDVFRSGRDGLLEPNYLPFMLHRIAFGGDRPGALVLCRWAADAFPLPVYIEPPAVDAAIEDEFDPIRPEVYVAAADRALATWERELEGHVRFRRVDRPGPAALRLVLVGERAPTPLPEVKVLGSTRLGGACNYRAGAPGDAVLELSFAVPELKIFVADEHGLLTAEQVEWIARHELGHALGMPGHSPIPADLMYEVVRDRVQVQTGLSEEDVNSFLNLYRLPQGTVFAWVDPGASPASPLPDPPAGPPLLALAPHVDPRLGFEIRLPLHWVRLATPRGVVAADGTTWDYEASFQVVVAPYDDVRGYLARYGPAYLRGGLPRNRSRVLIHGREALRLVIERLTHDRIEELTFLESGDGRVVVVIADAPMESYEAYRPWFWSALSTLEIWPAEAGR